MLTSLSGAARAGAVTYIYADAQGTPLAEADAGGNITATFDYKPYGSVALGIAPNGPGYTGHVNDSDTGLTYMQARYYDPTTGRFLSVDPIGPGAHGGYEINRYWYAKNNPSAYLDPDGRSPINPIDAYFFARDVGGLIVKEIVYGTAVAVGDDGVANLAASEMHEAALEATASTAGFVSVVPGVSSEIRIVARTTKTVANTATKLLPGVPRGKGSVPQNERDPKRTWTPKQNADKLTEQGGKCANCSKEISAEEGEGHHIERHADGGTTTDDNHAVVCNPCHKEIHARADE